MTTPTNYGSPVGGMSWGRGWSGCPHLLLRWRGTGCNYQKRNGWWAIRKAGFTFEPYKENEIHVGVCRRKGICTWLASQERVRCVDRPMGRHSREARPASCLNIYNRLNVWKWDLEPAPRRPWMLGCGSGFRSEGNGRPLVLLTWKWARPRSCCRKIKPTAACDTHWWRWRHRKQITGIWVWSVESAQGCQPQNRWDGINDPEKFFSLKPATPVQPHIWGRCWGEKSGDVGDGPTVTISGHYARLHALPASASEGCVLLLLQEEEGRWTKVSPAFTCGTVTPREATHGWFRHSLETQKAERYVPADVPWHTHTGIHY